MAIEFDYKHTRYKLEYNEKSIIKIENDGFVFASVYNKPVDSFKRLFIGAFLANHSDITMKKAEEIFSSLEGRDELFAALVRMYSEAQERIFSKGGSVEDNNSIIWEEV